MIVLKDGTFICNEFDMKEFLIKVGVDVNPTEIQEFIRILSGIEPDNVAKLEEELEETNKEIEELEYELSGYKNKIEELAKYSENNM